MFPGGPRAFGEIAEGQKPRHGVRSVKDSAKRSAGCCRGNRTKGSESARSSPTCGGNTRDVRRQRANEPRSQAAAEAGQPDLGSSGRREGYCGITGSSVDKRDCLGSEVCSEDAQKSLVVPPVLAVQGRWSATHATRNRRSCPAVRPRKPLMDMIGFRARFRRSPPHSLYGQSYSPPAFREYATNKKGPGSRNHRGHLHASSSSNRWKHEVQNTTPATLSRSKWLHDR